MIDEESYLNTERRCHDFTARDIPLMTTLAETPEQRSERVYLTSFSQLLLVQKHPLKCGVLLKQS